MAEEATGKSGRPRPERLKPERPRDELGRPQDWDAVNRLELEDFDALSLEENHHLGIRHFDAGRFFPAHEAWETAWKQARGTPDAEFFKGLSQLGAGYVHLLRGNAHGAVTLLRRAASRIERYPAGHRGIDTERVSRRALEDADAVERGELGPGEDALRGLPPPQVSGRSETTDSTM
ncbi:MAG: DUF309 domain-containing protein [Actinomycetota bacterium]